MLAFAWSVLFLTLVSGDDTNGSLVFLGFDEFIDDVSVGGYYFWEISGLAYDYPLPPDVEDTVQFYAVSSSMSGRADPPYDKALFLLTFNFTGACEVSNRTVNQLGALTQDGIEAFGLDEIDNTTERKGINFRDTECIAIAKNVNGTGALLINEGYRKFGIPTEFLGYTIENSSAEGNFEFEYSMDYNLEDMFEERGEFNESFPDECVDTDEDMCWGFPENGGFEGCELGMDTEQYLVYVGSRTLLQDAACYPECVRLVLATVTYTGGVLTSTDEKVFRYDVHSKDSDDNSTGLDPFVEVKDVTFIDLQNVLVLETYTDPLLAEEYQNSTEGYSRVFVVDLDYEDTANNYIEINGTAENFTNLEPVGTQQLFDTVEDLEDDGFNKIPYALFEGLSCGPQLMDVDELVGCDVDDCDDDSYLCVMASDNEELIETYFLYFCYTAVEDTPSPTRAPAPDDSTDSAIKYMVPNFYVALILFAAKLLQ